MSNPRPAAPYFVEVLWRPEPRSAWVRVGDLAGYPSLDAAADEARRRQASASDTGESGSALGRYRVVNAHGRVRRSLEPTS